MSDRPPAVLLAPLLLAKETEGLHKNEAAGAAPIANSSCQRISIRYTISVVFSALLLVKLISKDSRKGK